MRILIVALIQKKITQKTEVSIVSEFVKGVSTLKLSTKYKLPHWRVCDILESYNITPTRNHRKPLTDEEIQDYLSGMKMSEFEKKTQHVPFSC